MSSLLQAVGLTRRYGSLVAVDGVDLALPIGARHALIGPNGAGKSTLLHLVAGTLRATAGRVLLANRDVTRTGPAGRARLGLCRTFQTPALLASLSALDNLVVAAWRLTRLGGRTTPGRRYQELARRGLHHLDGLGLAHLAHTRAGALAHGQRRLLEIAVALAGRPSVLLLDEPGAGLGGADLDRLVHVLRQLPIEVAVLLVEHHEDLVTAVANTVTVLHHGQIIATDTPQRIHQHPAVAAAYHTSTAG
jgi:branched-chain amino acid transport system ATP-binding protein